jgi:nucleotide-binding universal stress UspA family protein
VARSGTLATMSPHQPTRILVAVDTSPASAVALHYALELAASLSQEVHVAHVTAAALPPAPVDTTSGTPSAQAHDLFSLMRQGAEKELQQFVNQHNTSGQPVVCHVLSGDPRQELLKCTVDVGATWLVVGRHGRGAVGRWLLGSVAEYLLRHSPVPVLLVPTVANPPSEDA